MNKAIELLTNKNRTFAAALEMIVLMCYLALFLFDLDRGAMDFDLSNNHHQSVPLEYMSLMWVIFAALEAYFILTHKFTWLVEQTRRMIIAAIPFYTICKLAVLKIEWYSVDWIVLIIIVIQFSFLIAGRAVKKAQLCIHCPLTSS